MHKWEYRVFEARWRERGTLWDPTQRSHLQTSEWEETWSHLAENGWELVSINADTHGDPRFTVGLYFFKRPFKNLS